MIEINFFSRVFNPEDRTEKYILVGIVNGNPKGCGSGDKERLFPDYHVSVGNKEVIKPTRCIYTISSFKFN